MIWFIVAVFAGLSLTMAVGWAFQRHAGNGGWTDVFWTFGLGAAGMACALYPVAGEPWPTGRQVLVEVLVAVWALRLGLHIAWRAAHEGEDARYARFRQEWGARFQPMMFGFLQLQALAAMVLALPMLAAAHNPAPGLRMQDWLGGLVLAVAIVGEGLADWQLSRFKADPANHGKVCDVGLWAWSRHPNYFFEWLGWLAYPLIAIDLTGHYLWGWGALAAPVYMYWLLRHVSGVPPLEEHMARSRGAAWVEYAARTSVFFPAPPHRSTP